MTRDKDNNNKKDAPSKKNKPKSSSTSTISGGPSTVLTRRSTLDGKTRPPSADRMKQRTESRTRRAPERKPSGESNKSGRSVKVAKRSVSSIQNSVPESRIIDCMSSTGPRRRERTNPRKLKAPNRNVPEEASVKNIEEQQSAINNATPLNDSTALASLYNDDVREEFNSQNVKQLVGTTWDPEKLLKPLGDQAETGSYLDRQVDPDKLISFMVSHMNAYYDLSADADAFSRKRQMMDDELWDSLAYIIPMLCSQVIQLVRHEPIILTDVKPDALVFGDVHGNFNDVYHIYKNFITNPKYAQHRLVFLGDYVDRGPKPVEIVCFLFAHKLAYPERFVLLRGNHEVLKVNRKYGFQATCAHIFQDSYVKHPILADLIYQSFNQAFCYLPVGAVIKGKPGRRVFCCHGGVPSQYLKPEDTQNTGWSIRELNALVTKPAMLSPSKRATPSELALNEILWNDPIPERIREKRRFKRKLFYTNKKRGGHCSFFTEAGLCAFLEANKLGVVVRGHQYRHCKKTGFQSSFNDKLLTVFSSSSYCGTERNSTGYALVSGMDCIVTGHTLRTKEESAKYSSFNVFKLIVDERTKEISVAF